MRWKVMSFTLSAILFAFLPLRGVETDYKVSKPIYTGWIQGSITHIQSSMDIPLLQVDRDSKSCGKEPRKIQAVEIGPNGALRNSLVYLKQIQSGKDFVMPASPPVLKQEHCQFEPHVQLTTPFSSIRITNADTILHSIHAYQFQPGSKFVLYPNSITYPANTLFNIAMVASRKESFQQLGKSGIVKFVCDAGHYWMTAYAVVMDHPYYVKVELDGTYRIEDVPTGTYTLVSWHEYFGTQETQVQIKANQPTVANFVYKEEL